MRVSLKLVASQIHYKANGSVRSFALIYSLDNQFVQFAVPLFFRNGKSLIKKSFLIDSRFLTVH